MVIDCIALLVETPGFHAETFNKVPTQVEINVQSQIVLVKAISLQLRRAANEKESLKS